MAKLWHMDMKMYLATEIKYTKLILYYTKNVILFKLLQ
jgi:hypothetical protein